MSATPRRELVVEAAGAVLLRYGFARVSMTDIASAAGVSRQTVYRLVGDKNAVFLAVAERLHDETIRAVEDAAASRGTVAERVAAASVAKLRIHVELSTSTPHGRELLEVNRAIGTAPSQRRLVRGRGGLVVPGPRGGWGDRASVREPLGTPPPISSATAALALPQF